MLNELNKWKTREEARDLKLHFQDRDPNMGHNIHAAPLWMTAVCTGILAPCTDNLQSYRPTLVTSVIEDTYQNK